MPDTFPVIRDVGLTAKLVTFAGHFTESANRAALAFRAALEAQNWDGVEETAISLTSVYVGFDPLVLPHEKIQSHLADLLKQSDWLDSPLPPGRSLWCIPVVIGGDHGPEFLDAAQTAGLDPEEARQQIADARVRVLTIGFAPGQPYMGELDEAWNIPRMSQLNPRVPGGSLVIAIRQLIIFAGPAPTGWRHIGQTAFSCFRPRSDSPFALSHGDEVTFRSITAEELDDIQASDDTGNGGATCVALT